MKKNPFHSQKIVFSVMITALLLTALNFFCGLIVQNRYIALEPVNQKLSSPIPGYYKPHQERLIMLPGLPPYKATINALGFRISGPKE